MSIALLQTEEGKPKGGNGEGSASTRPCRLCKVEKLSSPKVSGVIRGDSFAKSDCVSDRSNENLSLTKISFGSLPLLEGREILETIGKLEERNVSVAIDSFASCYFIPLQLVKKFRLPMSAKQVEVSSPFKDTTVSSRESCVASVIVHGSETRASFAVIETSDNQTILERPWFSSTDTRIDWRDDSITFERHEENELGNVDMKFEKNTNNEESKFNLRISMSLRQATRALKKGVEIFFGRLEALERSSVEHSNVSA